MIRPWFSSPFGGEGIWVADKDRFLDDLSRNAARPSEYELGNWKEHLDPTLEVAQIAILRTGTGSDAPCGVEAAIVAAMINGKLDEIEQIIIFDTNAYEAEFGELEYFGHPVIYDGLEAQKIWSEALVNPDKVPEELTDELRGKDSSGWLVENDGLCFEGDKYTPLRYCGDVPEDVAIEIAADYMNQNILFSHTINEAMCRIYTDSYLYDFDPRIPETDGNTMMLEAAGIIYDRKSRSDTSIFKQASNFGHLARCFVSESSLLKNELFVEKQKAAIRIRDLSQVISEQVFQQQSEDADEFYAACSEYWGAARQDIADEGLSYDRETLNHMIDARSVIKALGIETLIEAYDEGVPLESLTS